MKLLVSLAVLIGSGSILCRGAEPSSRSSYLADIGPAPEVKLIDAEGKPFDLAARRGKVVLVSFIFTTCGGTCPATTFRLGQVQRELQKKGLWGRQVEFVSISLDPTRDTPKILTGYARNYQADPAHWYFLTGPAEQVARVIAAWGMWVKPLESGSLDHPSRIFLVDPSGHQREIYSLEFLKIDQVLEDIRALLED